jgi:hypothetical protein
MKYLGDLLLPNEQQGLIDALRRDVNSERHKAACIPRWAPYHLQNARMSTRLLEAFGYGMEDFYPRNEFR